MWTISLAADPIHNSELRGWNGSPPSCSAVVCGALPVAEFFVINKQYLQGFVDGGKAAHVALSDFMARRMAKLCESICHSQLGYKIKLELLQRQTHGRRRGGPSQVSFPPLMMQRTDFWCSESLVNVTVRAIATLDGDTVPLNNATEMRSEDEAHMLVAGANTILSTIFDATDETIFVACLKHVACAVLQDRLRLELERMKAVAFVANGSILPRRSGASCLPMASPPAIPFLAPEDSPMTQKISVDLGGLSNFVSDSNIQRLNGSGHVVTLAGLVVPSGITLIVGGGYHGKSTLLRTIAAGVYNKVPGDGREMCVTVSAAVTVRAEDGRYVSNCNISAFISNLPTPPGVDKPVDTRHFSTFEASGSTSQSANVCEAIEMGATALLVDEDVSAANFMARDGRMRSLVMDESITPLLYRVNGLYKSRGISTIVVVGGVGDWLDVPDQVILMDKYVAKDSTKKARSISYQFSYGHVQYAGRGVVHRLEWEKHGNPIPRRPANSFVASLENVSISLLEGGEAFFLSNGEVSQRPHDGEQITDIDENDDDMGCVDMSRSEQLFGRKPQLFGCALAVSWVLREAESHPDLGIFQLLRRLEGELDDNGITGLASQLSSGRGTSFVCQQLIESQGYAVRPRSFEVGQALTRMRGIRMENLPQIDDGSDVAAEEEAERRKRELAELWNSRRKNKIAEK